MPRAFSQGPAGALLDLAVEDQHVHDLLDILDLASQGVSKNGL